MYLRETSLYNFLYRLFKLTKTIKKCYYYVKNNSLRITFKDLDEKTSKLKNYTLNNIDVKCEVQLPNIDVDNITAQCYYGKILDNVYRIIKL